MRTGRGQIVTLRQLIRAGFPRRFRLCLPSAGSEQENGQRDQQGDDATQAQQPGEGPAGRGRGRRSRRRRCSRCHRPDDLRSRCNSGRWRRRSRRRAPQIGVGLLPVGGKIGISRAFFQHLLIGDALGHPHGHLDGQIAARTAIRRHDGQHTLNSPGDHLSGHFVGGRSWRVAALARRRLQAVAVHGGQGLLAFPASQCQRGLDGQYDHIAVCRIAAVQDCPHRQDRGDRVGLAVGGLKHEHWLVEGGAFSEHVGFDLSLPHRVE